MTCLHCLFLWLHCGYCKQRPSAFFPQPPSCGYYGSEWHTSDITNQFCARCNASCNSAVTRQYSSHSNNKLSHHLVGTLTLSSIGSNCGVTWELLHNKVAPLGVLPWQHQHQNLGRGQEKVLGAKVTKIHVKRLEIWYFCQSLCWNCQIWSTFNTFVIIWGRTGGG